MSMIPAGTKCKLVVTPPGTTLWNCYKSEVLKATATTSVDGLQQAFDIPLKGTIYANGGNGFLVEAVD